MPKTLCSWPLWGIHAQPLALYHLALAPPRPHERSWECHTPFDSSMRFAPLTAGSLLIQRTYAVVLSAILVLTGSRL
jgi:hypothetical protein